MIGNITKLASNTSLLGSTTGFIQSTTIDLSHSDLTGLGIWYKLHSTTATPSVVFWTEFSYDRDGEYKIMNDSYIATASTTYFYNLSTTHLPFMRICGRLWNATPTSTYSCYIFSQEEY